MVHEISLERPIANSPILCERNVPLVKKQQTLAHLQSTRKGKKKDRNKQTTSVEILNIGKIESL